MRLSTTKQKVLVRLVVLGIWIGLWQFMYHVIDQTILVPSPLQTLTALGELLKRPGFYKHVIATLGRIALGVGISFGVGTATAVIAYFNGFIREFLKPFVITLKSTPVMGIIIIALLWFNANQMPVFVCFLMCYPVVYGNVLNGFMRVDPKLIEMSRLYTVKKSYILKDLYMPFAMPAVQTALALSIGLAFKVVIAAEVLAVPKYSMGYHLLSAKSYLEIPELFAWLVIIILLSAVVEMGISRALLRLKGGRT